MTRRRRMPVAAPMPELARPDEWRCSECGSPDVVAGQPGDDEVREGGILLVRGTPTRLWCLTCWRAAAVTLSGSARR
jgi:hypothetical protein